ncbi:unnamed protein product [Paramecium octaurelia]|uniref:Uncharacterized protein n=1 Tax=Paramecium octaurelia TaxID=43137 RepID=A0A8S1XY42_PAROT|nr:unnamed protein product [Paramecium octaurelia]
MYQQHSHDIVISKDNRNAQSANKSRSRHSPYNLYQNLTHKNSSHSKDHSLFPINKINTNHDYQPSIDVQDLSRPSQSRQSHKRNKTDADRSTNLNNRISLLRNDAIQRNSQSTLNKISTNKINRLRAVKLNQTRVQRDILDRYNKQHIKLDFEDQQLIKPNNYLIINSYANDKDRLSYEGSRQDSQQKQRNESISYTDSKQFKQSTIKQIQDFHSTKLDQVNLNKQEDYMKFSFGFQCTKIKSTKKFPKDIFYNDVRKAKKCLSNQ